MVILFSSSNLKQKLLQVRFEIRKKRNFFDWNTRISLRFNKLQFLDTRKRVPPYERRKKRKKKRRRGRKKKKLSKKKKRSRNEYWVVAGIRNQTKATLCASCIREQGGGEGVEEEEATLRGAPVNTFSDVVICRWFRPAGGQPFFHAFLRLPDLNPLKRLEQLFRVISSKGVGEVKLSRGGRIHPPKAKMQNTLENTGPKRLTGTLPRESSPARSYPMKIMQKKILPPL